MTKGDRAMIKKFRMIVK